MKPTDITYLTTVSAATVSPDGTRAVVASSRPRLSDDTYQQDLWELGIGDDTAPRKLTHTGKDSAPQYSPDGRWIAFLRPVPGSGPQIHLLPVQGGDARQLTDLPGGAGLPVWSPDSQRLAFAARVMDESRKGPGGPVEAAKAPPRRITGLQYRYDGLGFTIDQRFQLFVTSIRGDTTTQITDAPHDHTQVDWSPEGSWLAFVSARHASREHDMAMDVFVVRPDGTGLRQLTDTSLRAEMPKFSADGSTVFFRGVDLGPHRDKWVARQVGLYRVDALGGAPQRLSDAERVHLADGEFVVAESQILALVENRGSVDLVAFPLDGADPVTLSAGQRHLTGIGVGSDSVVVSYRDQASAGEVAVVREDGLQVLTDFGARLKSEGALHTVNEIRSVTPDGVELQGFVVVPRGAGPHPVLLMIHGGPFAQYNWGISDDAQVLAAAGYAVVYGNPRGSSGIGAANGAWIRGQVGPRSADDLYVLLDAALRDHPALDPTRLGVFGGSHGGFMTSWIIGHTDRFKAAVSERSVNALDSFEGSSDVGWAFAEDLFSPDRDQWAGMSPLTYADRINTPLLIIHAEDDWRCPVEQAQRLYVALRRRDAEVEMLLFPSGGHNLTRTGLPSHRVARLEALVEWFGRHLGQREA